MNKANNNTSCTTASTLTSNKITREILKNKQITSITNGTSGCLYVTNVNLYLHPNQGIDRWINLITNASAVKQIHNNSEGRDHSIIDIAPRYMMTEPNSTCHNRLYTSHHQQT